MDVDDEDYYDLKNYTLAEGGGFGWETYENNERIACISASSETTLMFIDLSKMAKAVNLEMFLLNASNRIERALETLRGSIPFPLRGHSNPTSPHDWTLRVEGPPMSVETAVGWVEEIHKILNDPTTIARMQATF